jgi:hypothetical protein
MRRGGTGRCVRNLQLAREMEDAGVKREGLVDWKSGYASLETGCRAAIAFVLCMDVFAGQGSASNCLSALEVEDINKLSSRAAQLASSEVAAFEANDVECFSAQSSSSPSAFCSPPPSSSSLSIER